MAARYNSEWLSSGMVKVFYDGVLDSWTAVMVDDYADRPGWRGEPLFSPRALRRGGDRGRPARPADRRACDRRRRGAGRARRLRGGAKGERQARQPPPHRAYRGDAPQTTCRASPSSASSPRCSRRIRPARMGLPLEPTVSRIGRAALAAELCLAHAEGCRRPHLSSPPTGRSRRSTRSAGMQAAILRKPWADEHARPELHADRGAGRLHGRGRLCRVQEDRKGRLKPGYLADLVVLSGDIEAVDAGSAARGAPGDDDLRRQDHLPGVTLACGLRFEPRCQLAGCQAALPCGDIRIGNTKPPARAAVNSGACACRTDRAGMRSTSAASARSSAPARGQVAALDKVSVSIRENEFFTLLGPSGCGKTTLLRLIAGFDFPTERRDPALRRGHRAAAAVQAAGQHGLPELRAVPAHDGRRRISASAWRCSASRRPRSTRASTQMLKLVRMEALTNRAHQPDLRRPAAARGARPRAGAAAQGAAARRAAVGARLQAAQGDADRAEAAAARDRHHLHLRHPRPGRGADHVGPHRGDVGGQDPADRHARATSTTTRPSASSPTSSARPISSQGRARPRRRATARLVRLASGAEVAGARCPKASPGAAR